MTIIAGIAHKGRVWVGGDSAGSNEWRITTRKDDRVFKLRSWLIGCTSSYRMTQLIRYHLNPPALPAKLDAMEYMVGSFVPAIRHCLRDEEGGDFLVGFAGRLFAVYADFQVAEPAGGFTAIGSGGDVALGAMHATPKLDPAARVRLAMRVAEKCTPFVRGPFRVLTQ